MPPRAGPITYPTPLNLSMAPSTVLVWVGGYMEMHIAKIATWMVVSETAWRIYPTMLACRGCRTEPKRDVHGSTAWVPCMGPLHGRPRQTSCRSLAVHGTRRRQGLAAATTNMGGRKTFGTGLKN